MNPVNMSTPRLVLFCAAIPAAVLAAIVLVALFPQQMGAVVIVAGGLALYLTPTIVTVAQGGTSNAAAIVLINIFAGWTVIGWVGALAWAAVDKTDRQIREEREAHAHRQAALQAYYAQHTPPPHGPTQL